MTLAYQDKIPPVDVDHIDYALKRANLGVERVMVKEEEPRIIAQKAVGSVLYLTLKRPAQPYAVVEELDEEDPSQWVELKREHRRFSIQEVLDDIYEGRVLAVTALDAESYIEALGLEEIVVTEDQVAFSLIGNQLTIESTEVNSLMWWGKGPIEVSVNQT